MCAVTATAGCVASASSEHLPLTLLLLRHGESVEDRDQVDHQRGLTAKGRSAVKALALKLASAAGLSGRALIPQLVVCSDSVRSRETVAALAEAEPAFGAAPLRVLASLYVAAATDGETAKHLVGQVKLAVSRLTTPAPSVVLCVGHNRGWEEAASELTGEAVQLRTASAAVLTSAEASWDAACADAAHWSLSAVLSP